MRIAYLVNQYPKVSHSFIRREIHALEKLGFSILRISLRGWDDELVDKDDFQERKQTRYVLRDGVIPLLAATLRSLLMNPVKFWRAPQTCFHDEPRFRSAASSAHRLFGGSLSGCGLAPPRIHWSSARPFRHQFGRSGDARACIGRAALEFHRPRAGGVRQSIRNWSCGKDPTRRFCGRGQLVWPEPAVPPRRSCAVAKAACCPLWTGR